MLKPSRLFLAFTLLSMTAIVASATDYGDIVVTVAPGPSGSRLHGYIEYRIAVANRDLKTAHDVRLTIPGTGYGVSPLEDVSRAVTVHPSSTVVVSLLVPGLQLSGDGLGVSIDGRRESERVPLDIVDVGVNEPSVLISQNADRKGFSVPAASTGRSSYSSGPVTGTSVVPQFAPPMVMPVAEWSENWLGYSSFDCVIATGDEIRALPANVSSSLWQYVKCGGTLLVVGSVDVPEAWRVRTKGTAQIPTWYVGYGACLIASKDGLLSDNDWLYVYQTSIESQSPFSGSQANEPSEANAVFPVVEKLGVPVRGLFLLMLLFVIVIGPVNLFILSRKKRKIWLLWTVPAISLVTCVAVSAYTILTEGWSGKARTAGVTILDEASHQATTIGWSAFYSPLTPGDGLHYGYETELTPQIGLRYDYYNRPQSSGRVVDWTEDQHLSSGWVTARVPAHFKIRKSEMRRERVTLSRGSDGSLTAVNGLGVDVRELWLADRDGKIYRANNVRAGASAALALQANSRAHGIAEELRLTFASPDWFSMLKWTDNPDRLLMPGCYIAAMDSSPFIEDGLRNVGARTSEAVVYGIMKIE